MSRVRFPRPIFSRSALLLLALALPAVAQVAPGTALPDALKGIKPAGGVCLSDDVAEPGSSRETERVIPDLSCAVAPQDILPLLGRPGTLLADMRSAADYEAFRIDGALHLTEEQLRAKRFLREKTVVLVGGGNGERELYAACARLKAGGFKQVRVLRGGLAGWLAQGQSVVGRRPERDQPVRLTPSDFWQEAQFDGNVVMVVPDRADIQPMLPFSVVIPDERPETIRAVLERRRKELGNAHPMAAVVLVAGDALDAERLRVLRRTLHPVPVLAYTDSTEALSRQVSRQRAVWAARARGPKQAGCGL